MIDLPQPGSSDSASHAPVPVVPYESAAIPGNTPILRAGGAMGMVACCVGLVALLFACAGFDAALKSSLVPLTLGIAGFVVTLVGANVEKAKIKADTHVLAALFSSCLAIIGGLVEMAVWLGWPTLK